MPCYYTGSREGDMKLAYEESNSQQELLITKLTRMLCGLCDRVERWSDEYMIIDNDPELKEWWTEHQKIDGRK